MYNSFLEQIAQLKASTNVSSRRPAAITHIVKPTLTPRVNFGTQYALPTNNSFAFLAAICVTVHYTLVTSKPHNTMYHIVSNSLNAEFAVTAMVWPGARAEPVLHELADLTNEMTGNETVTLCASLGDPKNCESGYNFITRY